MDSPLASLSPEASFLREEAREAKGKCLVLREKQVSDSEFTVMLRSMSGDHYFAAIDVAGNQITDAGAAQLAEFIASGAAAVQVMHIERNAITDKGGEVLLASKTTAFNRFSRNCLIHARGNPMSEELVLALQTGIVQLDRPRSRPASASDSFPSILGPSPIPDRAGGLRPQGSLASDEGLEGSMQLSEAVLRSGDLADLSDPLDPEVTNLRSQSLQSIPEQLSFSLNLKRLALANNAISSISHLPQYLEALELRNNRLTTISGLEHLSMLLYLDLSENGIERVEGLEGNCALREVSLERNRIREIAGLEHLRELRRLNLGGNGISTFMSIRTISMNTNLKILVLMDNPICLQAKYRASVVSLLPKLCMLDFRPLSSYRNESFSKTQTNSCFFSIDFVDIRPESTRVKVTPRFPIKTSATPSSHNSLFPESVDSDLYSPIASSSPSHDSRPKQPKAPKKGKKKKRSVEKSQITIVPPPPPPALKPVSVYSTFLTPEEPITSVALSEEEKEAATKHLRALVLFRGLPKEFFLSILDKAGKGRALKGDVLQDGSLLVSRLLLVLTGRVQWKNLLHGAWTAFFLESLITPTDAEDNIVCLEPTEFVSIDRDVVIEQLENLPEAKAGFFRNYDNLQNSREQHVLSSLEPASSDVSRRTPSTIPQKSTPSQSAFFPKSSFQQLIKPDLSRTFAFSSVSSDPRSQRIQAEIQKLLASDPFRPEPDPLPAFPPTESFAAWQEALSALKRHVSGLVSYQTHEVLSDKQAAEIAKEAELFSETGPLKAYELIALERESLKLCVEQAFLIPVSQTISEIRNEGLFDEFASILGSGDEDDLSAARLLSQLEIWTAEIEGETHSCMLALSNVVLFGKDESLVLARLAQDRVVTSDDELTNLMRNPKAYVEKRCRRKASDPQLTAKLTALLAACNRNNYCKRTLERLLTAVNVKNDLEVEEIKRELVLEGVLSFGMAPCKAFLKGEKREMELKTRAELRKSDKVKGDSSVASEVSSARGG